MAKTKQQVAETPAETFLLPHERGGESAEAAARSLFDASDSEDDIDLFDDPEDSGSKNESTSEDDSEEFDEAEFDDDLESDEDEGGSEDDDFEDDRGEGDDEVDDDFEGLTDETLVPDVPVPGGETVEVTLAELKAGYSRTADYTRKRQRDAAEHAETMESLRDVREQYDARLAKLQETLEEMGPKKPDSKLKASNPGLYAAQTLEWQEHQDNLKIIGTEREAVDGERQKEVQAVTQEVVREEWQKLQQVVPEWKDPDVAQVALAELGTFARETYGFTQEQLDNVVDHRLILMLRENMGARQKTERGRKRIAEKKTRSRKLPPGSRKRTRRGRKTQAGNLREKLARGGGSVRDHARLFELEGDEDL